MLSSVALIGNVKRGAPDQRAVSREEKHRRNGVCVLQRRHSGKRRGTKKRMEPRPGGGRSEGEDGGSEIWPQSCATRHMRWTICQGAHKGQ